MPTETEPVEGEINDAPRTEDNPLLRPDLDSLIENKIAEDVWSQLKGDLPCIESTQGCILQLQSLALSRSPILREMDARIEEAENRIAEARSSNLKTINVSTFSPFLQVLLGGALPSAQINKDSPLIPNPLTLIFGNVLGNVAGELLGGLFNWQGLQGGGEAVSRVIAIGDLQIKVAELQRNRAESANRLRELVLIETLKLEEIARDFQIQQEIARRERARIEIIRISYRFGQGNSEGYLSQLSGYDRQKAQVWREWSRMRSQLTKVKILVIGVEEN
ncbi:hypothetical protein EZJ55_00830 [Microcystis aeruginosa EAWAG127a]|uniref:TolC family protein n=1 Tax=Microcystis aeruginosa EAWAG127a TaxID=2529855 RepID=A0A5J5M106_MICAE|nr:hypothetical protein EZJ55_24670 [Microcystis aeruginosa EAWAG127a]KAB0243778.1 hypothetical protein EZJ55_00830 [Microcystis aeruginosa EAWAG127a]